MYRAGFASLFIFLQLQNSGYQITNDLRYFYYLGDVSQRKATPCSKTRGWSDAPTENTTVFYASNLHLVFIMLRTAPTINGKLGLLCELKPLSWRVQRLQETAHCVGFARTSDVPAHRKRWPVSKIIINRIKVRVTPMPRFAPTRRNSVKKTAILKIHRQVRRPVIAPLSLHRHRPRQC